MRNPKISNKRQIASITRYTLTEGRGAGLDVIDCDNGRLRFMLCVSRALDIMQMWHKGENVSFVSKNGFVNDKGDFLSRFEGGMLYTCGTDSMGGREGFVQHGTHHITGAAVTRMECDDNEITVEATITESALFGRNLTIKRCVQTEIGSETVRVTDTLINEGYKPCDYCLLYHVNVGYPLLDAGATVEGKISSIYTKNPYALSHIDKALLMEEATYEAETCYYLTLDEPVISLVNKERGKKFSLKYTNETLPAFLMWKSMVAGDYALGLEPCTTRLDNTFEYKKVEPGESVKFGIELSVNEI